jgi:arylsulfatase A-like enzyme
MRRATVWAAARRATSGLSAVLACTLLALFAAPARAADRPNVVVILVDDMGYGDLGAHGASDIRTPNIDRLGREGVRLTNFYANGPVCTPTRAACMTGRYQQRVGLEWAIQANQKEPGLPATEPSLARLLHDNGYATALFGKWHLGVKPEFGPNAHGFEEFFGILGGNVDMYSHRNINGELDLYEQAVAVERDGYLTDQLTDRAVQFINRSTDRPFFLFVAYNAVHLPFQPPGRVNDRRTRETWQQGTRADYAGMLENVDANIGRLLKALDSRKLTRETMLIFTNDNGGERLSRSAPFFHHKGTLWEGGIRVPCFVRWPGRLPSGRMVHEPAMTMDLTATILAATGTTAPRDRALDGRDLLPVFTGRDRLPTRTLFWRIDRIDRKQKAARQGRWKYLRDGAIDLLFDIEHDPGEREDVSYQHPDTVGELKRALEAWERDVDRIPPRFSVK